MKGRIRFRYFLPAAHFAIYVLLIGTSCQYFQQDVRRALSQATRRQIAGEPGWEMACIDFTIPVAEQLANGLSAPAVLLGELLRDRVAAVVRLDCKWADYMGHLSVGIFVRVFWFFMGRWVDQAPTFTRRHATLLVRAVAVLVLACLGSAATIWLILTVRYRSIDFLVIRFCVLAWLAFGIAVSAHSIMGHHNALVPKRGTR